MKNLLILFLCLELLMGVSYAWEPCRIYWGRRDIALTYNPTWIRGEWGSEVELFFDRTNQDCISSPYRGIGIITSWNHSTELRSIGAKVRYSPYIGHLISDPQIRLLSPYGFLQVSREFSSNQGPPVGQFLRTGVGTTGYLLHQNRVHLRFGMEVGWEFYDQQLDRDNSLVISASIGIGINTWNRPRKRLLRKKD
ncbi:MAG: hypothetical protein AAGI38_07155 [Bacteroidota bacterium]